MAHFARNPADAIQGIIDWTTPVGAMIAKYAPKELHKNKFMGTAEDLQLFLQLFKERGTQYGWFTQERDFAVGLIREEPQNANNTDVFDVTEYYGSVTRQMIKDHALEYLFPGNDNGLRRTAQDDAMAFACLQASLDTDILKKVLMKPDKWKVEDPQNPGTFENSAILFLKTVIETSTIQTNATSSAIRTKLSNLDTYILQVDSDIIKFNEYVEQNLAALTARGEETTDILTNLWKAYKSASDREFSDFIKRRHEEYEMDDEELSHMELMDLASNKYKLKKENGTWNAPNEDEKKIIALEAEVASLKKLKTKLKKPDNNPGKFVSNKPEELKSKPKNVHKVVKWKGRDWYFCCKETGGKCGGVWRAHKPKECDPDKFKKKTKPEYNKQAKETDNKKIRFERAVSAIANNANDEDEKSTTSN
jgi:hypothetical protein